MTSQDLHVSILDSNFTVGKRYIGRCSQVYRGKKAIHVACGETYTKVGLDSSTGCLAQLHQMFLSRQFVERGFDHFFEN